MWERISIVIFPILRARAREFASVVSSGVPASREASLLFLSFVSLFLGPFVAYQVVLDVSYIFQNCSMKACVSTWGQVPSPNSRRSLALARAMGIWCVPGKSSKLLAPCVLKLLHTSAIPNMQVTIAKARCFFETSVPVSGCLRLARSIASIGVASCAKSPVG